MAVAVMAIMTITEQIQLQMVVPAPPAVIRLVLMGHRPAKLVAAWVEQLLLVAPVVAGVKTQGVTVVPNRVVMVVMAGMLPEPMVARIMAAHQMMAMVVWVVYLTTMRAVAVAVAVVLVAVAVAALKTVMPVAVVAVAAHA